ncbi:MAG: hypothetical protein VYE64_07190 [Planctomycetota bacterium]|nr:hypothetical protein [Planctomycetota bacterium]
MNKYEIWLRRLVCLNGGFLLIATLAMFLPVPVMARIHELLGLGRFPDDAITVYLARSTSLMYAIHGALTLYIAVQWNPFYRLVPFLALLHVLIGFSLIGIDVTTGMPSYWTCLEGGPIACFGLFLLWLYRRAGLGLASGEEGGPMDE